MILLLQTEMEKNCMFKQQIALDGHDLTFAIFSTPILLLPLRQSTKCYVKKFPREPNK
jgi:hypothetical protein